MPGERDQDPPPHPASLDPSALDAECEFRATRRSGPGGQNRNKVETAVILTHRPTGSAPRHRSVARRARTDAPRWPGCGSSWRWRSGGRSSGPRREPSVPERLWRSRCRGGRIVVNPDHDDFPALLAEALDVLTARDDDPKEASEVLGCSATQLVKLIKDEPRALARVNERAPAGRAAPPPLMLGASRERVGPRVGTSRDAPRGGMGYAPAGRRVCSGGFCDGTRRAGMARRLISSGLGGRGGRYLGELLGGQLLEGAAVALEAGLEPQGDLAELGRVDQRGQLGELRSGRGRPVRSPWLVELELHPHGGLPQLGVGLGGTAEDQALVAAGHAVLVVGVVQAQADEGGTESAGPWAGLLHQRHRAEGLSHGRCRGGLAGGQAKVPVDRPGRLATRLSYRILPGPRTAPVARFARARRGRPATVLRSTQAFLRDRPRDAIGRADGHARSPRSAPRRRAGPRWSAGRPARGSAAASRGTGDTSAGGHWRSVDRPRRRLLHPSVSLKRFGSGHPARPAGRTARDRPVPHPRLDDAGRAAAGAAGSPRRH